MAGTLDFVKWGVDELVDARDRVDLCVLRFAAWAVGHGAADCALCAAYLESHSFREDTCGACPIARDGHDCCCGTPYVVAGNREDANSISFRGGDCPSWLTPDDCAAEIRYMLRLRRKLTNALVVKAAARAKKAAKAKAARKKAART